MGRGKFVFFEGLGSFELCCGGRFDDGDACGIIFVVGIGFCFGLASCAFVVVRSGLHGGVLCDDPLWIDFSWAGTRYADGICRGLAYFARSRLVFIGDSFLCLCDSGNVSDGGGFDFWDVGDIF